MKKLTLSFFCLLLASGAFSQTKNNRIGISTGGGSQKYNGDLGNGFTLRNRVWKGSVATNMNFYLSRSFDIGVHGSIGDFGYCQPHDMVIKEVAEDDKCSGCVQRVGLGNLSSRMYIGGILMKYKFNNGYIFQEDSRIHSYVYTGISVNKLTDRMKMNCVNAGNYGSLNAGIGVRYYLNDRINIGYNLNIGTFLSDELDYISRGKKDMYLQNTFFLGIDLF